MPPLGAIAGAVASAAATAAGAGAFAAAVIGSVVTAGVGIGISLLQAGGKSAPQAAPALQQQNVKQTLRDGAAPRRLPYGRQRLGGVLDFYWGPPDQPWQHMTIVLGDAPEAPWQAIDIVWMNDVPLYADDFEADGRVAAAPYWRDLIYVTKYLGGPDQVAGPDLLDDPDLGGPIPGIDAAFRKRGVAFLHVKMKWNPVTLPNGIPSFSVTARTNQPLDPRTGVRAYTANAAVCAYDWYRTSGWGYGLAAADMDADAAIAAANACDEIVDTLEAARDVASVDAAADGLVFAAGARCRFQDGDRVRLSTTGTLPGGLAGGTDYFVIEDVDVGNTGGISPTGPRIRLAASLADVWTATAVAISSAGTGTLTVTKTGEPRYLCDTTLPADATLADRRETMLSAFGFRTIVGGKVHLHAWGWRGASAAVGLDDLAGPLSFSRRAPLAASFNTLRALHRSPLYADEVDWVEQSDPAYVAEDGGVVRRDQIDLAATSRPAMASRLARIALHRHRHEGVLSLPCQATALDIIPPDVIAVTEPRRGWAAKPFEVLAVPTVTTSDDGQAPAIVVDLQAVETSAAIYVFTPAADEAAVTPAPLAEAATAGVATPTGLAAINDPVLGPTGDTVYGVICSVDAHPDARFKEFEFQFKAAADSVWRTGGFTAEAELSVVALQPVAYDFRVRAFLTSGEVSDWQTVTGFSVSGDTAAPAAVADLAATPGAGQIALAWSAPVDGDVYYGHVWEAESASFAASTRITAEPGGRLYCNPAEPQSYVRTGLGAAVTRYYWVTTTDRANNTSLQSNTATGTTP